MGKEIEKKKDGGIKDFFKYSSVGIVVIAAALSTLYFVFTLLAMIPWASLPWPTFDQAAYLFDWAVVIIFGAILALLFLGYSHAIGKVCIAEFSDWRQKKKG